MIRLRAVTAVLTAAGLAGCAGGTEPTSPRTSPASSPAPSPTASETSDGIIELTLGKTDLSLAAGRYRSPAGFRPTLVMTVPAGWTSVHRGIDGFDFGKPKPTKDAPLIAVVIIQPAEPTAAAALAAVRSRATGGVQSVDGAIGTIRADGIDIDGGSGEVVVSADSGIALDAAAGQRVRVLAVDLEGGPLLAVVLVPDGRQWRTAWPQAAELLAGFTAG